MTPAISQDKFMWCLKNATLFFGLIFFAALLTPSFNSIASYKLPASEIEFRTPDTEIPTTRFEVQPSEGLATQQFFKRTASQRRFHYKFDINDHYETPYSIYIPNIGAQLRLQVNSAYSGLSKTHDFFASTMGRHWKVFEIPPNYYLPGKNRLNFFVNEDVSHIGLRQVYFGPQDKIKAAVLAQEQWMRWTPLFICIGFGICLTINLLGVIYGQRKTEFIIFGCLSLMAFLPGIFSIYPSFFQILEYSNQSRFILPIILLSLVILAIWSRTDRVKALAGFYLGLAAFGALGSILAVLYLFSPIFLEAQLFITTLSLLSLFPFVFILTAKNAWSDFRLIQSRLQTLEKTVTEQSEALDSRTQIIIEEMRQRALMEERQRFTRDIHDGIGGKLLSLLLQVRTGELNKNDIANELQSGIHDLRMVVDSIDQIGEDLGDILDAFRRRTIPQMKAAKIEFIWTQPKIIKGSLSGGKAPTLNLYRLMQEIITNAVRHADASCIEVNVKTDESDKQLIIYVKDDGKGIPKQALENPIGGVKNMYERAESLKASLNFRKRKSVKGTEVILISPLSNLEYK